MGSHNYPPDLRMLINRHGHLCIGSAIGYRVCKFALKLIDKGPGLTVYTGSGGCLQHAIEILTGCSRAKGTIISMEDQGWGFYDHTSGEGYRLSLKREILQKNSGDKESLIEALLTLPDNDIFTVEAFDRPGPDFNPEVPETEREDPVKSQA
ncbi:MAG: formylmethanofuran dehydrogenase subunit E family protein [Peptococcaceae bacterium]|nr:formylmethanofuran dehydrogenase subunit E family protein [Peptococcaceae bacterium]